MKKDEKVITTAYLKKKTMHRTKVFAADTNQSVSEVMDQALNEHITRNKARPVKE